ncbi:hypothetical protein [Chitinophaga sp. S165]|uniref:hypothetical protein n=1 Tax=Chitinophaga sp. S165 TaxID=2135462 RepID=UPI000D70D957|nr:hypothetical protein [Chitinophaga sp. S165]PWV55536.1 hypothetical protein C7475_10142 [Chitinophaga sp. S165]
MKTARTLRVIVLFLLLVPLSSIINSCSPVEQEQYALPTSPELSSFFDSSGVTNPEVLAILNEIKRQNQEKNFLRYFVDNNGYPVWNKAIVPTNPKIGTTLIPLSSKSRSEIQGFLTVNHTAANYKFRVFLKKAISRYGNQKSSPYTAERVFKLINYFDLIVYGTKTHAIPDIRLLRWDSLIQRPTEIDSRKLFAITAVPNQVNLARQRDNSGDLSAAECFNILYETEIWWDPDGADDPCHCSGNESYHHSTFDVEVMCTGSGGGGGGDVGDPDTPPVIDGTSEGSVNGGGSGAGSTPGGTSYPHLTEWWRNWDQGDEWDLSAFNINDDNTLQLYTGLFWDGLVNVNAPLSGFSATQLRNLALARGWNANRTTVEFNRYVGKAFEETALKFFGLRENRLNFSTPLRTAQNGGTVKMTRPDNLDNFMFVSSNTQGTNVYQLVNWFATEVKAYHGTLELSYNNYQILGELEMLAQYRQLSYNDPALDAAGVTQVRSGPVLFFITTADTQIGASIIARAQSMGINIWQSKAVFDPATNQMSFEQPKFVLAHYGGFVSGQTVPKNYLNINIQGYSQGVFGLPMPLQTPLTPNFVIDPEELVIP